MDKKKLDETKKVTPLSERIVVFHTEYPAGKIVTKTELSADGSKVISHAEVFQNANEPSRSFTAHAEATTLVAAENSAIERALAIIGIGTEIVMK